MCRPLTEEYRYGVLSLKAGATTWMAMRSYHATVEGAKAAAIHLASVRPDIKYVAYDRFNPTRNPTAAPLGESQHA